MSKHSIDLLQEACGATGRLQVDVEREGKPELSAKRLFLPMALVGRDENTDLPLWDPQISRRHAYMQMIDGRLFGLDLNSRTGTHWAGARRGAGWVSARQPVRIGPFTLRFSGERLDGGEPAARDWDPLTAPPLEADAGPDVVLELPKGPTAVEPWRMTSTLALIGRASNCGLVLPDPSVWSFHCCLLRTSLGTWVIDLLGQGGICLGGRRVRWGRLDDGDHLLVGKYLIRIRHEAPVPAAVPAAPAAEPIPVVEPPPKPAQPGKNGEHPETLQAPTKPAELEEAPVAEVLPEEIPAEPVARPVPWSGPLVAVAPAPRTELTEAILSSLFNQFAAMQNQMFDQFQQAIMMMVEMFSDMQRDQVGLIRQEVDRLHEITRELEGLQEELARPAVYAREWEPQPAPMPSAPETTVDAPPDAVSELAGDDPPFQVEAPAPAAPPPAVEEPRPFDEPVAVVANGAPAEAAAPEPAPAAPKPQASPKAAVPPPVEGEVHVWLYDKIAALQKERQTRLQKILNFLRGI